ncbi:hypothetical protein U8527_02450 [Kordia algicida OT-1]|uniref:Uncharacterized protein n=1 Tax=Kordia algicida OT-1 TaxID=391587 RepID=A9DNE5_9FLAO|nr:hypothetical protein [Kordia algicida]EDP97171.1 hypothetical protein KAOT1_18452 [Kordia algicida OT-1]
MKYKFPKKRLLIFFLVLVVLCWILFQDKIQTIGDNSVKVIESFSLVIGTSVAIAITVKIIMNSKKNKEKKK